jgi:hypothetical protein
VQGGAASEEASKRARRDSRCRGIPLDAPPSNEKYLHMHRSCSSLLLCAKSDDMSNIRTLPQEKKGIDFSSLSKQQQRRMILKSMKEMMLTIADKTMVSDADLQRLMQTGFANSIGPHMRALFPPVVTNALHFPMHAPEYQAKLSPAEYESALAKPLPLPPHHEMKDLQCTVGTPHTLHQEPQINRGTSRSIMRSPFVLYRCCYARR